MQPELGMGAIGDDAVQTLDLTGRPYVFFQQRDGGQAAVLHRRYDGHCGLITASGPAAPAPGPACVCAWVTPAGKEKGRA